MQVDETFALIERDEVYIIRFSGKEEVFDKRWVDEPIMQRFVEVLNTHLAYYVKKNEESSAWAKTYQGRATDEVLARNRVLEEAIELATRDADAYLKSEIERLQDQIENLKMDVARAWAGDDW